MNITIIRIDDRLIHGQIITKWIDYAGARQILVVDERSAADPMLKMILGLAVPSGIRLEVLAPETALNYVKQDTSAVPTLMIVRNPETMLALIRSGFPEPVQPIVLGNMSYDEKKPNVRHVLDYLYLNDQDAAVLKELDQAGAGLIIKAVPEERGKTVKSILHE